MKREPVAPAQRFRPHPWHGLAVGPRPPEVLNALRVDRPQRSSAQPPALYGFVPRTYCDQRVRRLAPGTRRGDGDPLDICVLSERTIARPSRTYDDTFGESA